MGGVGALRQIGMLRLRLEGAPAAIGADLPPLPKDGPEVGSAVPELVLETVNGHGSVSLAGAPGRPLLLLFLSPMCETCQHVVGPLNELADAGSAIRPVVVMRADEYGCRSFDSVFPLRAPVICDSNRDITPRFGIHRNPFGILYDGDGALIREGTILGDDHLRALLGDASAPESVKEHIFPWPESAKRLEHVAV